MKVDFFFIGPSKTASTWLYQALKEHPSFNLSPGKDIYFFDRFFHLGIDWYHQQFSGFTNSRLSGDFSHDYIISERALSRIAEYNPEAKILVCLRNPFERTESGVRFLRRNGYGYCSLPSLISEHTELLEGSLYGKNLERVYRYFGRSQVLLLQYDQLCEDSAAFLGHVYDFFDVSPHEPSVQGQVVNKSRVPRMRFLALMVKWVALIARNLGMGKWVGRIKMNPLVGQLLYKDSEDQYILSTEDRIFLAQYFNPDIDRLSRITGQDYSGWKHEE